jgi:hypothetical protein
MDRPHDETMRLQYGTQSREEWIHEEINGVIAYRLRQDKLVSGNNKLLSQNAQYFFVVPILAEACPLQEVKKPAIRALCLKYAIFLNLVTTVV